MMRRGEGGGYFRGIVDGSIINEYDFSLELAGIDETQNALNRWADSKRLVISRDNYGNIGIRRT